MKPVEVQSQYKVRIVAEKKIVLCGEALRAESALVSSLRGTLGGEAGVEPHLVRGRGRGYWVGGVGVGLGLGVRGRV